MDVRGVLLVVAQSVRSDLLIHHGSYPRSAFERATSGTGATQGVSSLVVWMVREDCPNERICLSPVPYTFGCVGEW